MPTKYTIVAVISRLVAVALWIGTIFGLLHSAHTSMETGRPLLAGLTLLVILPQLYVSSAFERAMDTHLKVVRTLDLASTVKGMLGYLR